MYKTFSENGYSSPDAFFLLTVLASEGAERLGLSKETTFSFDMGYGFVKTGFISCHFLEPKQLILYRMFYPLGVSINKFWELEPTVMKEKLRDVYKRFLKWDGNPEDFRSDHILFTKIDESWNQWHEIN